MLRDDTPTEQEIGNRSLTSWPSSLGRWLVRLALRLARLVSAHAVLAITAGIGAVLLTGFAVAGAEVYEAVTEGDGVAGLDRPVLDTAISLRSARLDRVLTGFTHLGGPTGMTIIASLITVLMVWRWRSRTPLILMIMAVAGSLLITMVGKELVGRMRPPLADAVPPYESSPSFPSGHALNSTVIAGIVGYLLLRRLSSMLARVLTVAAALGWAILDRAEPGLPGASLADRRDVRLAGGPGLAGGGDHRAPAVPDRTPRPRSSGRGESAA